MDGGNISNSRTVTLYTHWNALCTDLQINHLLEEPNLPYVNTLQVYGNKVCYGHYSSQSKIFKKDSVATACRSIIDTQLLEGRRDPRNPHSSHTTDFGKRLTGML